MAVTGKTSVPVVPGIRKVGATLVGRPEASAQTHPYGAIAVMTSGFLASAATGCVSTNIFGFYERAGKNLASDGADDNAVWRAQQGQDFVATLDGTWSASYRNATCAVSMNTAGVVVLKVGTAVSASSCARMQDVVDSFTVGDSYPLVSFVLLDSAIQA